MPKTRQPNVLYRTSFSPYSYPDSAYMAQFHAAPFAPTSYAMTAIGNSSSRSHSTSVPLDEPPQESKAKKSRKSKDLNASKPEKREARFKSSCPQQTRERAERVINQRFYVLDRQRNGDELREEYSVLGSTANVYSVVINNTPSCTCPDSMKGHHCKHILFIFLKVLQVPMTATHWYQKALLNSELEEIFRNAPAAPNALANSRVREAYARASGKALISQAADKNLKKRAPGPDDDCPVCYESMHGSGEAKLSYCDTCGNCLHTSCFSQWAKSAKDGVTCVYCRAPWAQEGASVAGRTSARGVITSEGYLNLSEAAGVSPVRDTSSYYQGPRRGQRYYGYQTYGNWRM